MRSPGLCLHLVDADPERRRRTTAEVVGERLAARAAREAQLVHVVCEQAGADLAAIASPARFGVTTRARPPALVVLWSTTQTLWTEPIWRRAAAGLPASGVDVVLAVPFMPAALERRLKAASALAHAGVRHLQVGQATAPSMRGRAFIRRADLATSLDHLTDRLAAGGRTLWATAGDMGLGAMAAHLGARGFVIESVRHRPGATILKVADRRRGGLASRGRLALLDPYVATEPGKPVDLVVADLAPIDVLACLAERLSPGAPLLVRGPAASGAVAADWYPAALSRAARRFRDHGLVWAGADVIERLEPERAVAPGDLVEEVYRRTGEGRLPPMLNTASPLAGAATT